MGKKYDIIFSMGEDCVCAQALRDVNYRKFSSPFDWLCEANFSKRFEILLDDFAHFFDKNDFRLRNIAPDIYQHDAYINTKTGFHFLHDFPAFGRFDTDFDQVKEKYDRRINRILGLLNTPKKALMVYIDKPNSKSSENNFEHIAKIMERINRKFLATIDLLYIKYDSNHFSKPTKVSEFFYLATYQNITKNDKIEQPEKREIKKILSCVRLKKTISDYMETLCRMAKKIYSKQKTPSHKIYTILGIKIKFKRRKNGAHKNYILRGDVILKGNNILMDHCEICSIFPKTISIGKDTRIGLGTIISNYDRAGEIVIGNNCAIGYHNNYYGQGGIEIGNNVITASYVCILSSNHGWEDLVTPIKDQPSTYKKVTIGDDCWIGYNVIILAGVHIGKHVVIGAGSVVTKDMPDYSVCAGNPCHVIKKYNFNTKKWEKVK